MARNDKNDILKRQKAEFMTELRYAKIDGMSQRMVEDEKRSKRLGVIIDRSIRTGSRIKLSNGLFSCVRFIKPDGLIILENWDEIDPLCL